MELNFKETNVGDDDDYMSDTFLKKIPDTRQSLVHKHSQKRVLELEAKKANLIRKQREEKRLRSGTIDRETLQKSLEKPLDSNNKGYQMLMKMGYRAGETLGKQSLEQVCSNTKGDNMDESCPKESPNCSADRRLKEPIPLQLKMDRHGLGRKSALDESLQKLQEVSDQESLANNQCQQELPSIIEYRQRLSKKSEEVTILRNLKSCQSTCRTLDLESELEEPQFRWFWPPISIDENSSEEHDTSEDQSNEADNAEKLDYITEYLRKTYLLCFWCSIRYKDEEDLQTNCPGPTKDDHSI